MTCLLLQYSKIIQNPSYGELQKAAIQGRRCTWEKLSAIKANCEIELALDECVAILNHMRRLKRMSQRAASASASASAPPSAHASGLSNTLKFSASRRIPSWNCIARESSTGSLEDLTDASSSLLQGLSSPNGVNAKTWKTHQAESDSESVELNTWTRSGGPLTRTTSSNMFIDFLQNLGVDTKISKSIVVHTNPRDFQYQSGRLITADRNSDSIETEHKEIGNRFVNGSSILVTEGDLLQPEKIDNGIVLNVVKKDGLTPSNRCHDFESYNDQVVECVQIDSPGKEDIDTSSSGSEYEDAELTPTKSLTETPDLSMDQNMVDS